MYVMARYFHQFVHLCWFFGQDYFVLLPDDFYLAAILNKKVEKPCAIDEKGLCRDYTYLNLTQFSTTYGVGGYIQTGRKLDKLREYFQDTDVSSQFEFSSVLMKIVVIYATRFCVNWKSPICTETSCIQTFIV
jgi:hypothetical protein